MHKYTRCLVGASVSQYDKTQLVVFTGRAGQQTSRTTWKTKTWHNALTFSSGFGLPCPTNLQLFTAGWPNVSYTWATRPILLILFQSHRWGGILASDRWKLKYIWTALRFIPWGTSIWLLMFNRRAIKSKGPQLNWSGLCRWFVRAEAESWWGEFTRHSSGYVDQHAPSCAHRPAV